MIRCETQHHRCFLVSHGSIPAPISPPSFSPSYYLLLLFFLNMWCIVSFRGTAKIFNLQFRQFKKGKSRLVIVKRSSRSWVRRYMQIKSTIRYHFSPITLAMIEENKSYHLALVRTSWSNDQTWCLYALWARAYLEQALWRAPWLFVPKNQSASLWPCNELSTHRS